MANKTKETMEYWPHSTFLFHDLEMRKLIAKHGIIGYTMYCYLMEQVSRDINKPLLIDEQTRTLASYDLRITEDEFDSILNTMLNLGMFNKDLYTNTMQLTNDKIEEVKENVKNIRANSRARKQTQRNNVTRDNQQEQSNKENDNVLLKDKLSKVKLSKVKLSEDNIIFIGDKKITKITDLYPIISNLFNKDSLNETELMELERLWSDNPYSLCKAIEICQKSATKGININYLLKAYQQAKSLNLAKNEPINSELDNEETSQTHSEEELEDLKKGFIERRNKRRNSKNQDSESFDNTSESINEAEELERLKAERRRKKEESKND